MSLLNFIVIFGFVKYVNSYILVSLTMENGEIQLHSGIAKNWTARANFSDTTMIDGWSYLEVESSAEFPDIIQSYAAGYVEGASSHEIIYNSWRNTQEGFCKWKGEKFCKLLREYLQKNTDWMRGMIQKYRYTSPLWHQVEMVLSQLTGLWEGYNENSVHQIPPEDFILMNLSGDLEDLDSALKPSLHKIRFEDWLNSPKLLGDGRCSALVKVLPGNTDLLASHVTWNTYQSMLRVQKKYILPFNLLPSSFPEHNKRLPLIPGHISTFSSYPTYVHSGDDYYLLSSGLLTMETTIGNSNPKLWDNVNPVGELQEWIRVLVANRLAKSGKEWSDLFKQYNSGTYNNQWMVVDYKKFKPGKPISAGTLWVLEQLPGHITTGDESKLLGKQTYWPSYNTPYYPDIYNLSGIPALVEKYGDWFSYDKTPRANIFRRDHTKVKDLETFKALMRYNDFKNDPLSACKCSPPYSAENGISARSDLNPKNGTYPFGALGHRSHGGTDVKVTSLRLFFKMRFQAVNGPSNDQQPTFRWSDNDFNLTTPHYGQPESFNFSFVEHKWIW